MAAELNGADIQMILTKKANIELQNIALERENAELKQLVTQLQEINKKLMEQAEPDGEANGKVKDIKKAVS